ncbi:hypothetical protein [Saccharopolyspora shandongensis]|uniref:hypothetical protein n=1 Tax=Saccharopolyspora shandongensis TaxID=418495 RepID=UPI0033EDE438
MSKPVHASTKLPWLLVLFLTCLVIALAAGMIKSVAGASLPEVVLFGGGVFLTALGVLATLIGAVRHR